MAINLSKVIFAYSTPKKKQKTKYVLKDINLEKTFIDELRCRNGNLEISIADDVVEEMVL